MGTIVAIDHLSLDGVMQAPGRPDEDLRGGFERGGWAAAANDPVMMEAMGRAMGPSWSLLVGRITYEAMASFWPKQPANPITDSLNSTRKFVVSSSLTEPLPWKNSTVLHGDPVDSVATLKKEHGRTLVIFGSGMLVQSLMRPGLIDEFVLQIHPLVLGQGRRLFPEEGSCARLRLVDSVTAGTGVIVATYRLSDR
jgi:dihydrofolate reductase